MYRPELRTPDRREVLRYLGWRGGALPPETEEALDWGEAALGAAARPRAVYRLLPLEGGRLAGCAFQPEGRDAAALLAGCGQAVLMAATLGAEADALILRTEARDMARAVVLDAVASAAVEAVCDDLEDLLRRELAERGLFLTERFSPGYGDMPLSQQGALCAALDAQRRIGLTVSAAGLLQPRKSVTALLGAADRPRPRRDRDCRRCGMFQTCPFRKDGGTCEK